MTKIKKDITLGDVITHIRGVKQELQDEIRGVKKDVRSLRIQMNEGFKEAKEHREALQEDLVATMQDIVTIRRHVGMPVRSE